MACNGNIAYALDGSLEGEMKYLVLLTVTPLLPGQEYPPRVSLPLHCTLMHWFELPSNVRVSRLERELARLAQELDKKGVELLSCESALFGTNEDVPVHVLERNSVLQDLHTRLLVWLAKNNSVPADLSWIGAGYRPHVAMVDGRPFLPGSRHRSHGLVLIERDDSLVKRVRASFGI